MLSQHDIAKVPLQFTVHLPDGTKDVRDFDSTMPLVELLENICSTKGWKMEEYLPKMMDDKDVDLDFVLGEVKEKEIKIIHISPIVDETKPAEILKTEKHVKRIDRGKYQAHTTPAQPAQDATTQASSAAGGRRGLVRQNSYVSIKAWNANDDEDEQESLKRVVARSNVVKTRAVKNTKSPLVVAMEREHKAMLEKLNLDEIKMPPPLSEKDNKSKLRDVSLASLDKAVRDLEAFEHIYGANKEFAPENFFKDLL